MLTRRTLLAGLSQSAIARGQAASPSTPWMLWYRNPATRWLDALPIGNGRLGAMIFGGVQRERIALNEATVWSGAPSDEHENPTALEHLSEIRRLFFEEQYVAARDLCAKHLLGRRGSYGTHLPMADLWLDWQTAPGEAREYRRSLNLEDAEARVEFTLGDAHITRQYLASHPAGVIAVRFTSDKPAGIAFTAQWDSGALPGESRIVDTRTLALSGKAREKQHSDGTCGVDFQAWVRIVHDGGTLSSNANRLTVQGANAVTLLIAAHTTYRGGSPETQCRSHLDAAQRQAWPQLRAAHLADYRPFYRRVTVDLGGAGAAARPTDERLAALRKGAADPHLSALFLQYSRYLSIAGSRADSPLPLNLQGIWNDNLACNMGWTCDFHLDINTQQNYWNAEAGNLADCHDPLFRLTESLRIAGRKTARKMYGAGGWVCHVFTNAWGYTAPGWGLGWGLHGTAGAWIASHLWEHYLYSGDRTFLAQRAYPVLKEAAEFFLDAMVVHPKYGWLVTGPAVSPENPFLTPDRKPCAESMGPTCDSVLVGGLFDSCIEASRVLSIDVEFRRRVTAARAKLPPLRVGRHGQLQEWLEDFEEAQPNHRHTTHLIALYPGNQISRRTTPALAQAARVTIARRTGQRNWEDVEWSRANLINFFARLGDGTAAHRNVIGLLRDATDNNLLTYSRAGVAGARDNIFIIDGNMAGGAGIMEMLLQSQAGEIELLPALPPEWPAGAISGLRARGAFEVGMTWAAGKLTAATIRSVGGKACTLRYGEKRSDLKFRAGESITVDALLT